MQTTASPLPDPRTQSSRPRHKGGRRKTHSVRVQPKISFQDLVAKLNHQSVKKHFDAYVDVDWDSAEFKIDPEDPRWELPATDLLGATAWYQAQTPTVRRRIGLHTVSNLMKVGLQFESVLQRGLLEFATTLPNRSAEFRYAYHEVIEEAQHSLMFQEFVNRAGFDVKGIDLGRGVRRVTSYGRDFPELFFFFVLGGEEPIDFVQRRYLAGEHPLHPLLRRIMQLHVTEEARHLCFARNYLLQRVPHLSRGRRLKLAILLPIVLSTMAKMMLRPSAEIVRAYGIPRDVMKAAYRKNPAHRAEMTQSIDRIRALCEELRILTPRTAWIWRWFGFDVTVERAPEPRGKGKTRRGRGRRGGAPRTAVTPLSRERVRAVLAEEELDGAEREEVEPEAQSASA